VTFPVHLAAYRQVAVDRAPPALVRLVALVRRALVALEHRAELVRLPLAVRSAVVAVVARGAVEQIHSRR